MPKRRTLEPLVPPGGVTDVLLHSCCAPCSCEVIRAMHEAGLNISVFFYNPNIQPRREYELRKSENKRYAERLGLPFIDADYDLDAWFARTKGQEGEPERGARCTTCFDMRLERSALYAHEHGFRVFTSSLGISRWKDMDQTKASGLRAAAPYDGLEYWTFNWRKSGGSQRMYEIAKRERFYKQEYCGCAFSLRDSNAARRARGYDGIQRGQAYYGEDEKPVGSACQPNATESA